MPGDWLAVKELKLSTILGKRINYGKYTHYGDLI